MPIVQYTVCQLLLSICRLCSDFWHLAKLGGNNLGKSCVFQPLVDFKLHSHVNFLFFIF